MNSPALRAILLAIGLAASFTAFATFREYANKTISHVLTDPSAWNPVGTPVAGDSLQIAALDANATTWVTNDYLEPLIRLDVKGGSRLGVRSGELTFVTTNAERGVATAFRLPDLPSDSAHAYGSMLFQARHNADLPIFDVVHADDHKGPFSFEGVHLQLGNADGTDGTCVAKFNAGTYNFGDPNGAANGVLLRLGADADDLAHARIMLFRPGTALRYDKAQLANGSTDSYAANRVEFDGASVTGLTSFTLNNGSLDIFGGTVFGVPTFTLNNGRLNVFGGTVFDVSTLRLNTGSCTVTGATTIVSADKVTGGRSAKCALTVADGAVVRVEGESSLGLVSLSVTGGGKYLQAAAMTLAAKTNAVSGAGSFIGVEDSLTLDEGALLVITNGASVSASPVALDGAAAQYVIGEGSSLTNGAAMAIGSGTPGSPHRICVNGGVFTSLAQTSMNSGSLIEVNGGAAYLQTGYGENLCMGWGSATGAVVRLNDGYVETSRIRMGRGSKAGSHSRIEVNGGRFTVSGYINFHQGNASADGIHEIVLTGGVLETGYIDAGDVNKLDDLTDADVCAYLMGDGGTLRALAPDRSTAASPFVESMRHVWCGDQGLTVDTQDHTVYFNHSLENKVGEEGLFRKVGSGTLILATNANATAVTDVNRIEAAEGTLAFADNMTLGGTTLVVANGATLSLAGAASLAVAGLAVTNGTVSLDPGDVITVDGPLALSGSRLVYTTLPGLDAAQPFLVAKGELSSETKLELLRMAYSLPMGDGCHGEYETDYDEMTGMTTVRIKRVVTEPIVDTATWTALEDGAWATAANWQGGARATERTIAVFNAMAEGKAATVKGDRTGAIRFEGGTHVIDGVGLEIAGVPGEARIDVETGSHTLRAPLDLLGPTLVAVADGATLMLGDVNEGALEKRGLGHLILDGALDLKGMFSSRDGLVTAANSASTDATTADALEFHAGTFESADADGEPMRVNARFDVAGDVASTAIVFKAVSDVTFADYAFSAGNVVKYGPGKMTIEIPADSTKTIASGTGSVGYSGSPKAADGFHYRENGSHPEGWLAKLTVLEGELVLKGLGDNACANVALTCVGGPCRSPVALQPTLTVDGASVSASLQNGYGLMSDAGYTISHPCVRVINGGTLSNDSGQPAGYSCKQDGTDVTYAITNATLKYTAEKAYVSRATNPNRPLVRYFLNNSDFIVANELIQGGSVFVDVDNGSYFGRENGVPMTFSSADASRIYGEIFTHGGSTLALSQYGESASQSHLLTLAFDDGEWIMAAGGGDCAWPASVSGHTAIEMRGRGAILKPASGATYTTLAPFTGTGGLVVDGPGTVRFGAANTYAFAGVCEVRQGIVDLTGNGTLAAATFAGAGTVTGANVTRVTMRLPLGDDWMPASTLTFTDCTFGEKLIVDAGRTTANPLVLPANPRPIAVATFSGCSPPACIVLRNTGTRAVSADFSVVGGTLYMTPSCAKGLVMIVR